MKKGVKSDEFVYQGGKILLPGDLFDETKPYAAAPIPNEVKGLKRDEMAAKIEERLLSSSKSWNGSIGSVLTVC